MGKDRGRKFVFCYPAFSFLVKAKICRCRELNRSDVPNATVEDQLELVSSFILFLSGRVEICIW